MRLFVPMALATMLASGPASALDVRPEVAARGWFFSIDGTVDEDTDLDALDFDSAKGQPEVTGALGLGERHRIEASWLGVRRFERGIAEGQVLGIIPANDEVAIDVEADYVRAFYGYELPLPAGFRVMPFLGLGYLREESDVRNETTGNSRRTDDSGFFPLPGVEASFWPLGFLGLRARASGIGTGRGHLFDVEGGLEAAWALLIGGIGYRFIEFRAENDREQEVADLELRGVWVRGGVRF